MQAQVLDFAGLNTLIQALRNAGYRMIGPAVESGALVYRDITSVSELPHGLSDRQKPGQYRLTHTESRHLFDRVVGPESLKTIFHRPQTTLWEVALSNGQLSFCPTKPNDEKIAVIGVRPCEVAAMLRQDRVFFGGEYTDPRYQSYRQQSFLIAVNCTRPGGNCFCSSMHTGPEAKDGFDLSLTEIDSDGQVVFVTYCGSSRGQELLDNVPHRVASKAETDLDEHLLEEASRKMGHKLETVGLKEVLQSSHDNPHWREVESRCLACGSCTSVCPTCFCSTIEEVSDLSKHRAKRVRKWTSCFTREFTYLHGGHVRLSGASRYRHWLTHKLAAWHDQFGTSGCVGCGRCITWCPVGINIVEEATAVVQSHKRDKRVAEEIKK